MTPRSILKRSSERQRPTTQHAVHFPPTPALCSTYSAYSASAYDRTPIQVTKNICALPERNGRTYFCDESSTSSRRTPRSRDDRRAGLPQLIPDVSSSSSDESDAFHHSPSTYGHPTPQYSYGANGLPMKYEYDEYSQCNDSAALAFLPYPPSPPAHDRSRGRRKHDNLVDSPRIRESNSSSSSTDEERTPAPTKKRSSSRRREYLKQLAEKGSSPSALCTTFGAISLQDDGCLGGF
ncbi:hypothetical protein CC2G_002270 [Coprinopsis cinerea AmutBmut pab1-1]|nr:hypothetical protein CC2G_002270 [Coprinopsis cinerea AmutBmut pab1-1]